MTRVPDGLRVTVLGKSPSWQDAGGACTGFLIREADTTLLLDCGSGVFGKLREHVAYTDVDAVVISHLHADHFLDLVPYANALSYGPHHDRAGEIPLFVPLDGDAAFRRLCGAWGPETLIEDAFHLHEYDTGEVLEFGNLRVHFAAVLHFARPTHAVRIEAGAASFVFSADTGPSQALVGLARDADLLFCEATLTEPETSGPRGHMTAREAGEHARWAHVDRLVLTHVSDELDVPATERAATEAFGAPVEVARPGASYDL